MVVNTTQNTAGHTQLDIKLKKLNIIEKSETVKLKLIMLISILM